VPSLPTETARRADVAPAAEEAAERAGPERRDGWLLLVTVVLAWGLTWPVHKAILETLPATWMVALRTGLGAVALLVLAAATRRLGLPRRADLPMLLSITLLHMVGFVLLTGWGLRLVPTGRSVVLAYTTPLWVMPGARLFLGEPLTARRVLGMVAGLAGLVTLFNPLAFDWSDRAALLGHAAILAAALLWAANIVHIRGHRWRGTPFELVPWEALLATAILVPVALATTPRPAATWDPRLVGLLLYSGLPGMALPYWAIAMAGRRLPAMTMSLGLLATPLVSIVVATVWLGERFTLSLGAAVVLILGGVALGTSGERAR